VRSPLKARSRFPVEPETRGTRIAHAVRVVRKYRLDGLRCLGSSLPINVIKLSVFLIFGRGIRNFFVYEKRQMVAILYKLRPSRKTAGS